MGGGAWEGSGTWGGGGVHKRGVVHGGVGNERGWCIRGVASRNTGALGVLL